MSEPETMLSQHYEWLLNEVESTIRLLREDLNLETEVGKAVMAIVNHLERVLEHHRALQFTHAENTHD